MKLDDLKKQYDKKTIVNIEAQAKKSKALNLKHRKKFIFLLYYLDRTSRYKQNARFKNATFEQYIFDMFGLTIGTYEKERVAFIANPDETEKYGVGVVSKARKDCGVPAMQRVFVDLDKEKKLSRDKIIATINKHARPVPERIPKPSASELQAEVYRKDKIIAHQVSVIKDQAEQIMRLKEALENTKLSWGMVVKPVEGEALPA